MTSKTTVGFLMTFLLAGTSFASTTGEVSGANGAATNGSPAYHAKRDWNGVWVRIGSPSDPDVDSRKSPPLPDPTDETEWPPLTPKFKAQYREITRALTRGVRLNDPTSNCLPAGFPWMMNMPYPMEILQTPGQMTVIAEWLGQTRRIYLGKHHDPDADPTYFGDSVANWEADTLVVDTVGLRPDTNMNDSGLRHGEKMRVVERWSMDPDGTLDDQLTVIDPDMLTEPWVRSFHYKRAPGFKIMEYVCENNRDAAPVKVEKP